MTAWHRPQNSFKNRPFAALLLHLAGKACFCSRPEFISESPTVESRVHADNSTECHSSLPGTSSLTKKQQDNRQREFSVPVGCFVWKSGTTPSPRSCSSDSSTKSEEENVTCLTVPLSCLPDGALSAPRVLGSDRDSDSDVELPQQDAAESEAEDDDEMTEYFKLLQEHGVVGPSGLDVRLSFKWRPVLPSILEVESGTSFGCSRFDELDTSQPRLKAVNRSLKLEGEDFYFGPMQTPARQPATPKGPFERPQLQV